MTLKNLEAKWSAYLSGANCPPVLGLAALSEEESEIIHQLIAAELGQGSRPQRRTLFALLHEVPGFDPGIGHSMLFEVDSEVLAQAPPNPRSPQTSCAASARKSAPLLSSRQVE